ncbi:MAG: peptidoglycan D,D-transpeptidase FtsI family protein [Massilia sp.]
MAKFTLRKVLGSGSRAATGKGVQFSTSPLLAPQLPAWRSRLVLFAMFAAFATLAGRALWLQLISNQFLQKQGAARYARTLELPATRGRITDRNGQVLALSLPVKAVWANPDEVAGAPPEKLRELARLLDMSEYELGKKLNSDRDLVYLKRQVTLATVDNIIKLGVDGIETRKEFKRYYPYAEVMAHIVGFTNVEDAGQEGMELAYQGSLAGANGSRRVIRDRLGHVVEDIGATRLARDGKDVALSIDRNIQHIAYSHLKAVMEKHQAKAAGIVVLDVRTGEILALANLPDYDPNDRSRLTGAQLRNRVLTDTFEPGSVMKPFTVALALENKLVTPSTLIETAPGRLTIGRATIGDSSRHGTLTVSQVLEKSSNVGTAKLALQMQPQQMWNLLTSVGFGQAPSLGFPGTAAGRVRPPGSWKPIEQATISYGHGISTSLIQMAQSYMIFARDGETIPITLLKTGEDPVARRVISKKTAHEVRAMMELAAGPHGTAPRAQIPGYRVAGKTSTAHKPVNGQYTKNYVSGFVGFAPASDPRIIVAVMVDEPTVGGYFGGKVAAPVFAAVTQDALRTLNIAPDSSVTDIIVPAESVSESF